MRASSPARKSISPTRPWLPRPSDTREREAIIDPRRCRIAGAAKDVPLGQRARGRPRPACTAAVCTTPDFLWRPQRKDPEPGRFRVFLVQPRETVVPPTGFEPVPPP